MTKRSVATVVILSIITCGIYAWWWVYTTANELHEASGTSKFDPIVSLLLTIFVPTAGYIVFGYDAATCIDKANADRGRATDSMLGYILLAIFIPIVLIGLVQNDINKYFE